MAKTQKKKARKNCISVSISIPIDLLDLIEERVDELECDSRSDFVIAALKEKLSKNN